MVSIAKILLLTVFATRSTAQQTTILPTTLPACAAQCQVLLQAQTGCVPPAAPVTNAATYQSCFCQSGYLSSLYASAASNLCQSCSAADMSAIQAWYKSFCPQQAAAANGQTVAVITMTTSVFGTVATVSTPTATPTDSAAGTSGGTSGSTSGSTSGGDLSGQDETPNGAQHGW